jgi:hypothetical protein
MSPRDPMQRGQGGDSSLGQAQGLVPHAQFISVSTTLNVRGLSLPDQTRVVAQRHPIRCSPRALCDRKGDRAGFFISHPVRRDRPSCRRQLFSTVISWMTCPMFSL